MKTPSPRDDESQADFIRRCAAVLLPEFPNLTERCMRARTLWDNHQALKSKAEASQKITGTVAGRNPGMATRWE